MMKTPTDTKCIFFMLRPNFFCDTNISHVIQLVLKIDVNQCQGTKKKKKKKKNVLVRDTLTVISFKTISKIGK